MKKIILLLALALTNYNCSDDAIATIDDATSPQTLSYAKGGQSSTSQWRDYNIAVSVSLDGTTWTYTITRVKQNAKDLSHFIIDLNNCGLSSANFGNIIDANVNGNQGNIVSSEGAGTDCNPQASTTNFVKFNDLHAATSWVFVLTFDRGYTSVETGSGWLKAGTSCSQGTIIAPGCPTSQEG